MYNGESVKDGGVSVFYVDQDGVGATRLSEEIGQKLDRAHSPLSGLNVQPPSSLHKYTLQGTPSFRLNTCGNQLKMKSIHKDHKTEMRKKIMSYLLKNSLFHSKRLLGNPLHIPEGLLAFNISSASRIRTTLFNSTKGRH